MRGGGGSSRRGFWGFLIAIWIDSIRFLLSSSRFPGMSRTDNKSSTKLKRKDAATTNQARVYWTREHDRVLIDLMVEQTLAGARVGAGFTRDAWFDMVDRFNECTRLHYDVDHLKNRLRFYKREYRIVSAIKNHAGFSWDHKMQMVIADDAEWDEYVRKIPEAKLYRTRQAPFINELEITFGPSASKGNDASSSRIHYVERNDTNGNLGEGDGTLNSFVDTPQTSNDPIATSADVLAEVPQDVPEAENINIHRALPLNILRGYSRKARRQSDDALLALREIAEASKRRISAEEAKYEKLSLLDECLEELNLMRDIDNELYVKALFIFKEEYNQHIFLKTTGIRRIMWLRAVTKDINLQ